MKLNIEVTEKNIAEARKSSKCFCPIALAVKDEALNHGANLDRLGKPDVDASIDHEKGRMEFTNVATGVSASVEFPLPKEARQFIRDRDAGKSIAPFKFTTNAKPQNKGSALNWGFDPNKGRDLS